MIKNIDQLTLEIASSVTGEILYKGMPPLVAARFRSWIRSLRGKNSGMMSAVQNAVVEKIESNVTIQSLQKNEVMASAYKDGVVRLDFGSDVPEKVKKAAISWAKKRGLKAIEMSLTKSDTSNSFMIFAKDQPKLSTDETCVGRYKIAISN